MQQMRNYGDARQLGRCIVCGGPDESRDHAPSRVFLDKPYPDNLPVLPSCIDCNNSFSLDEEYLACLIECAKAGSVKQAMASRPKIEGILRDNLSLQLRLTAARSETGEQIIWMPEEARVRKVMTKLAKAHVAFEQNEPQFEEPEFVSITPLCTMSPSMREAFEATGIAGEIGVWPEVGSRAMQRIAQEDHPWIEVQPGRYRYHVLNDAPWIVRIVIGDYLAAEVVWGEADVGFE